MTDDNWVRGTLTLLVLSLLAGLALSWHYGHEAGEGEGGGGNFTPGYYYVYGPRAVVFLESGDTVRVHAGDRLGFYVENNQAIKLIPLSGASDD